MLANGGAIAIKSASQCRHQLFIVLTMQRQVASLVGLFAVVEQNMAACTLLHQRLAGTDTGCGSMSCRAGQGLSRARMMWVATSAVLLRLLNTNARMEPQILRLRRLSILRHSVAACTLVRKSGFARMAHLAPSCALDIGPWQRHA